MTFQCREVLSLRLNILFWKLRPFRTPNGQTNVQKINVVSAVTTRQTFRIKEKWRLVKRVAGVFTCELLEFEQ